MGNLQFVFQAGPCDQSLSYNMTEKNQVTEKSWTGDTLNVKGVVEINCAEKIAGGEHELSGNTLILRYIVPQCTACTLCNCAHEVTFMIRGLEKGEYEIVLLRSHGIIYR